jgi:transposase
MVDMHVMLEHWHLSVGQVRDHVYRASTPRERERWHALWLLAQGWSTAQVAVALERDAHTIGEWVKDFREKGPVGLAFQQTGGPPPPSTRRNKLS